MKHPTKILVLAIASALTQAQDVAPIGPRCLDDCWCVPADGETCPASTGLRHSYPQSWLNALRSFVRTDSDESAAAVEKCFPFSGLNLDAALYPQSALPLCQAPTQTADSICVFVFDDDTEQGETSCTGRNYKAETFADATALEAANYTNSLLVHYGPCGVCSNAADLAARVETLPQMDDIVILCATNYLLSANRDTRFETLIQCFETNANLSPPCATMWAHFAATNAFLCPDDCIPTADNEVIYNDPETCEFTECLTCSAQVFEADFNRRAGLWKSAQNAGLVDNLVYPCAAYNRRLETFDPCVGAVLEEGSPTVSPTIPPPSGGGKGRMGLSLSSVVGAVFVLVLTANEL
eukprot:scaffold9441_cov167-Amphora_coffeaeformis.AAC.15